MHIGNAHLNWALDRLAYRAGNPELECIDANGPTIIHTGTRSPGWAKGRDWAAYVMPVWACRMASVFI